jgi:hypothetical protein
MYPIYIECMLIDLIVVALDHNRMTSMPSMMCYYRMIQHGMTSMQTVMSVHYMYRQHNPSILIELDSIDMYRMSIQCIE